MSTQAPSELIDLHREEDRLKVILTFPVWVDAELRVEDLVSLLFQDGLSVNGVLMNQIHFFVSCHVPFKTPETVVSGRNKEPGGDVKEFIPDFVTWQQ